MAQSDHLHGGATQTVAAPQESGGSATRAPKLQRGSLSDFVVQRPAAQLVAKLAKFRVEPIATGAQFMKDTVPAMCADILLESLKLAIETVFCAPPITDPYEKGIDKEFGCQGTVWKGDSLHCIPCNAKINGTTRQNVIDHVISDDHDERLLHSAFATQFHLAPGYEIRQRQREQRAGRRDNERREGGKRLHCEVVQQTKDDRATRRKHFQEEPMPPLLSQGVQRPAAKTIAQKEKPRFVQDFLKQWFAAGLPVHASDSMLPYLRKTMNNGSP